MGGREKQKSRGFRGVSVIFSFSYRPSLALSQAGLLRLQGAKGGLRRPGC